MNVCILMAQIIQEPQLRYTSDTKIPIAEMLVQFPGLGKKDPPATLKVVGWGNLAKEIQERYHQGEHVIIEGRLNINTVERKPFGFKDKLAELTAQRIHSLLDRDVQDEVLDWRDYTQYEYDAFGFDEDMGMSFEEYLDAYGYLG